MLLRAVASFCCFYSCGTSSAAAPSTQPQSNYCSHVPISRAIFLSSELPLVLTVVVIPLRYHLIPWIGPEGSSCSLFQNNSDKHSLTQFNRLWLARIYRSGAVCTTHSICPRSRLGWCCCAAIKRVCCPGRVGWWWWWWVRRDHKREIYGSY